MCLFYIIVIHFFTAVCGANPSPLLYSNDEQIVEKEEVDWVELGPHIEESSSFGHFLELSLLLQISSLGDDRDGLMRTEAQAQTFTSTSK